MNQSEHQSEDANNDYEQADTATHSTQDGMEAQDRLDSLHSTALELLKNILEEEEPPEGLLISEVDEDSPDLYSLLEAMVSLRQEISLQGRSFHQLEQSLNSFLTVQEDLTDLHSTLDRLSSRLLSEERNQGILQGFRQAFDFMIDVLMDTHDQFRRLDEQNQSRKKPRQGWLFRSKGEDDSNGYQQTVNLTLKKLNQRLEALGVIPAAKTGMDFDPKIMKAVELEETSSHAPNTVVEIFHQGYIHENRVLRYAEVKVSS